MYWNYGIAVEQIGLIGAEAQNYESVVRMQLAWIDATDVGKLLFRAIARNVLEARSHHLAKFNTPPQPGIPTRGVLVRPYLGGLCNAQEGNSTVWYTPYLQGPCGHLWTDVTLNRGMLPHEVLFHELVHALRDAAGHGTSLAPLTGGLAGYRNTEELIAVVVTNIFMTDPSNARSDRVGLRKDHGFGKLESSRENALEFFRSSHDAFHRIEQFCREDRWFTERLAETKATYNPVMVYYHFQTAARKASNSAGATVRDFWPRP